MGGILIESYEGQKKKSLDIVSSSTAHYRAFYVVYNLLHLVFLQGEQGGRPRKTSKRDISKKKWVRGKGVCLQFWG